MSCHTATALIEKKRDKKLDLPERIGLWVHLAYCKICGLFFAQGKILDDSIKAYAEKVAQGEKTYKLNPERKGKLTEAFDKELGK